VFQTGWFIESLLTELVIALVVRTRHVFFRSRPGKLLLVSSLTFIGITLVLPYLPFVSVFGFVPLPFPLMLAMLGLTALYVIATEMAKNISTPNWRMQMLRLGLFKGRSSDVHTQPVHLINIEH